MNIGDLVVAMYDESRGIHCVGLILQNRHGSHSREVMVMWSPHKSPDPSGGYSTTDSAPIGWWREEQLRVISKD